MRSRPFAALPRHVADAAQAVRPKPTRVARRAAGALLIAFTMAGSAQAAPPARPPSFTVDATMPAPADTHGRVVDGHGRPADFVLDELVVTTGRPELADEIARRWGGRVLRTAAGQLHQRMAQHLIRVDPSAADVAGLPGRARTLSGVVGTATRVSGERALQLIAAAAQEASAGHAVGLNWVTVDDAIADGSTRESARGAAGFDLDAAGYTRDAYRWSHLAGDGPQAIGVTSAWTLLEKAGRLKPGSVKLAVLDRGFAPEANGDDFGADPIARSAVPLFDPLNTCGPRACRWHGTKVLNAAAAVPDNGVGAAGPAGPIARPVVVLVASDIFTSTVGLFQAYAAGARIANMSYRTRVPATLSWTVLPFNRVTDALRDSGMLLYGSAGNEGENVDEEDCFFVCWEAAWHTPCENAGVQCVGGLRHRSTRHDDDSNYGHQVEMYAPFTVLVGPVPDASPDAAVAHGTSFAAPYVAGVAALARAAAPGVSAGGITTALRENARPGTGRAVRYVDALATVKDLLPRLVHISAPVTDSAVAAGTGVRFEAFVYEDGRGAPTSITWKLGSRALGTGASFTRRDLAPGEHTVTVTATFADGATVEDRVALTVTNQPPRVEVVAPAAGTAVQQSEMLTFRGESSDVNQPADGYRLRDAQVSWWLDGTRFATGHVASRDFSGVAPGRHTITFRGDDGLARVERSIPIDVLANTENRPPEVRITSPANNAVLDVQGQDPVTGKWYRDVDFTVSARDPEAGALTYAWSDRIDGGAESALAVRGDGATLRLTWERCGGSTHDVRVRVTDAAGQSASDTVRVRIDGVPC